MSAWATQRTAGPPPRDAAGSEEVSTLGRAGLSHSRCLSHVENTGPLSQGAWPLIQIISDPPPGIHSKGERKEGRAGQVRDGYAAK